MQTRRSFLKMLGFAPLAAAVPSITPAVTRAATSGLSTLNTETYYCGVGGITWLDELPEPYRSMMAGEWTSEQADPELKLTEREKGIVARAYLRALMNFRTTYG